MSEAANLGYLRLSINPVYDSLTCDHIDGELFREVLVYVCEVPIMSARPAYQPQRAVDYSLTRKFRYQKNKLVKVRHIHPP